MAFLSIFPILSFVSFFLALPLAVLRVVTEGRVPILAGDGPVEIFVVLTFSS